MGSWKRVVSEAPIFTYHYNFGMGEANALAMATSNGVVVVSPPCGIEKEAFAEVEGMGEVVAIVAPNRMHTLGIASWSARFPKANVYAPAQAADTVAKKAGVSVHPVSEATGLLGSEIELLDMPHYKAGELLVRMKTPAVGVAWYVTDVLFNMPKLPPMPIGLIFKILGSAPGFKKNPVNAWLMMSDKRAVYRWLKEEGAKFPPSLVIPSHGVPLKMDPPGSELIILGG